MEVALTGASRCTPEDPIAEAVKREGW
jgi:hypothetical protein